MAFPKGALEVMGVENTGPRAGSMSYSDQDPGFSLVVRKPTGYLRAPGFSLSYWSYEA